MASKKKAPRSDPLLKQDDILQAIVLADSFNVRFSPITKEIPRVLMPLVNNPLIDYTIEFLAAAGVEEIFVFCCAHADKIKKHIKESKWNKRTSPCMIRTIMSEGCHSVGDAMREIDRKALIRSDFILVSGDVVSSVQLKEVLESHRERFKQDKSFVMTKVLRHAYPGHRNRCDEDEFFVATDTNNTILCYQKTKQVKKVKVPMTLFKENCHVTLRYDLMDCHISICSSRVMELFTDNFDYQTMSDFMRGVIYNEEIEGNKMQIFVITNEYAARVSNLSMYDTISKDIIHRWTYPQVPEYIGTESYSFGRNHVYLAKDITLARGCSLDEDVVIGTNTSIGNNTQIAHSVIGRNCKIGVNVVLENAFIWDNVTIEANCQINTAILCDGVQLKSGVNVQAGSILSYGVIVGPDVTLPAMSYLSRSPPTQDNDFSKDFEDEKMHREEVSSTQQEVLWLGTEGVGYVWTRTTENEDEDDDEDLVEEMWGLAIGDTEQQQEQSSSDESEDDEDSRPISPPLDDTEIFYNQVLDSLQCSYLADAMSCDNLILEINSSKFANNVSMKELVQLVIRAIVEVPNVHTSKVLKQYVAFLIPLIKDLMPLLKNYLKGSESQLDCLGSLQECCLSNVNLCASLPKVLTMLYDNDILHEQVIIHWYKRIPADGSAAYQQLRTSVTPFITWLEEAEEESESEED